MLLPFQGDFARCPYLRMEDRLRYHHQQQEQQAELEGMAQWHHQQERQAELELRQERHPLEGMEHLAAYHPA